MGFRRPAATLFCLILFSALAAAQQVSLTILHTNDTHSHLLPFSYPAEAPGGSQPAAVRYRDNIGGIARRATLVKNLRAELESRGTVVWLVDAGDFTDGTPFSTEYHGEADIEAMNATGYMFATLGNHEFNGTFEELRKLLKLARFQILCANVTETATGKLLAPAATTRQVGPLKIGIFGLATREGAGYPAARGRLQIADEIDTARRMAETLHREADIVIALSHAGERLDRRIAAEVSGIDVIIGGHSHTRLAEGEFVWHSDELKPTDINGTIIVQAYQWGGELGRLDLLFSKDDRGAWHISRDRIRLLPVTSEIAEDETVAAVVDRYWKPIADRFGEIVGNAAGDFSDRGDDLASYNLVADAVRNVYGTEIELENMGGVRAPLFKGDIRMEDLVEMDPFANTVVTFKISGSQLKEVLLKHRPAVSGIRYRIENKRLKEATVGGRPIEDDRLYAAASNSYFAGIALKGIDCTDSGKKRLDVIIEYVRKKGTIEPSYDGRRAVIDP